jgi:hypothetical protein
MNTNTQQSVATHTAVSIKYINKNSFYLSHFFSSTYKTNQSYFNQNQETQTIDRKSVAPYVHAMARPLLSCLEGENICNRGAAHQEVVAGSCRTELGHLPVQARGQCHR